MKTSLLVEKLKENGQDFEFYPTTNEIIRALASNIKGWLPSGRWSSDHLSSVLDIGAGNGKVLEALKKADCGLHDFYAIEKSPILCGQLPESVYVVGTAFEEQSLLSKSVDVIFCNPPYSVFESWAVKIIRQAACKVVYLVIPERWEKSEEIKAALKFRDCTARKVGSFDFESAEDRRARANVHLLRIDIESNADEAFESFFNEEFAGLKEKFKAKKEAEDEEPEKEKGMFAGLVVGENYPEAMVSLYNAEMARIQRNYHLVSQLDAELLREFNISPASVCKCLKERLSGLRVLFWHELFSKMRPITDRLTSKSRDALLATLQKNCHVDFTVSNIQVVLLWAIRNANRYIESQLLETYEYMVDKANVVNYASNHKVFTCLGWRYSQERENWTHFALDYRIVMHSCGGISVSSYSWEAKNGLCKRAFEFIQDLLTVANNLGFTCSSEFGALAWVSNQAHTFYFTDGKGKRCELFEARAFKNQNMHLRLSKKFALALNVEHGRLRGWLRSKQEAAAELKDNGAAAFFNCSVRLLPDAGFAKLGAGAAESAPDLAEDSSESPAVETAPAWDTPRPRSAVPDVDAKKRLDLVTSFGRCVPVFKATLQRIAKVSGLPIIDVWALWREYDRECLAADQSAVMFEFLQWKLEKLGGNRAALEAAMHADEVMSPAVEEITQGRTIWNSDGRDGPVLICAPPRLKAAPAVPAADLFALA